LYVELYLIGEVIEDTETEWLLLEKAEGSFLLNDENDNQYVMKAKPVECAEWKDYGNMEQLRGEKYKGYMIVIRDRAKNIVTVKSNLPEWMTKSEVIANLRDLYARSGSLRSRYFDKEGKKASVPTPKVIVPHQR
jgi:uncharacterized protein YodC (DUF2158 family)